MRALAVVLSASTFAAAALAAPQQQREAGPPPAAASPIAGVTAAEVGVDFVVRDRKGRIVRDLQPSEVEVLEDGVPQAVTLFQLMSSTPADAGAGPEPAERDAIPSSSPSSSPEPSGPRRAPAPE